MNKHDIRKFIKDNEKVYTGNFHDIKYLSVNEPASTHLLVVFSGFNGNESKGMPAKYNYINTLENLKMNKMFILDSVDNVPVYYYGVNGEPSYLNDISVLIKNKLNELQVHNKNLIICGSSKGGTGALLTGFTLSAGHIIAGANQVYVGDYLSELSTKLKTLMFEKILGSYNANSSDSLNTLISQKLLITSTKSNLYFHAGNQDTHYKKHMIPLLRHFDRKNIHYELDLRNYSGHSKVGRFFPKYLIRKLSEIKELPHIQSPVIMSDKNEIKLNFSKNSYDDFSWAVYVTNNQNKIEKITYSKKQLVKLKTSINSIKKITVFLKSNSKIIDIKYFYPTTLLNTDNQ